MKSKKLVCMLRVKDGMLFARDWLKKTEALVDEIVVVDNGSTDGTLELLRDSPKVVSIDETVGFDEGRDKILVYNRAREQNPDWILWIDIDEIFEDRLDRNVLDRLMASERYSRYWFRRFHLHEREDRFEAGLSKMFEIAWPDRVMWRNQDSGYFEYQKIHCNLIKGITGKSAITSYRIKHYGSLNKEYLHKKTDLYISVDPNRENMYLKNRDQKLKTLRWCEYKSNPLYVSFINVLLTLFFSINYLKLKIKKYASR